MPNIQINLTKQVTTLATQNKYIPSNIDLIPQTEEKTITENGTFTPSEGKLGFSKVIVNIPKTTWTFTEKEQTITTNTTTVISKDASSDAETPITGRPRHSLSDEKSIFPPRSLTSSIIFTTIIIGIFISISLVVRQSPLPRHVPSRTFMISSGF